MYRVPENLTALVALNVVTGVEPPDLGSLINATLLKSFWVVKSPEFAVSAPSKEVLRIIKKPPNSSKGSKRDHLWFDNTI